MMRIALSEGSLQALQTDAQRRSLIALSLHLVPFAGIAFLWFIGVIREQLGRVEDRLFSTVFLGSGLHFLAMLFVGAVNSASLIGILAGSNVNPDVFAYGRSTAQTLISVYAMRMAAVFTLSVSTVGIRTSGMPRWVAYFGYLVALTCWWLPGSTGGSGYPALVAGWGRAVTRLLAVRASFIDRAVRHLHRNHRILLRGSIPPLEPSRPLREIDADRTAWHWDRIHGFTPQG